jgi:hypothetical protein
MVQDDQLSVVMSPVGTEVNSIPGVSKSSSTWMFPLNTSEVSNQGINNSVQFNVFSSIKSITSSRELLDIELVITIYIYIHVYIHVQMIMREVVNLQSKNFNLI